MSLLPRGKLAVMSESKLPPVFCWRVDDGALKIWVNGEEKVNAALTERQRINLISDLLKSLRNDGAI